MQISVWLTWQNSPGIRCTLAFVLVLFGQIVWNRSNDYFISLVVDRVITISPWALLTKRTDIVTKRYLWFLFVLLILKSCCLSTVEYLNVKWNIETSIRLGWLISNTSNLWLISSIRLILWSMVIDELSRIEIAPTPSAYLCGLLAVTWALLVRVYRAQTWTLSRNRRMWLEYVTT